MSTTRSTTTSRACIQTTDVMEAQTAWQSGRSDEIDALIEVRLADIKPS